MDVAIFGAEAEAFAERFVDPQDGQSLIARAVADGAAEGRAVLRTTVGTRLFRISMWRQRGGDRIRLVAAFAADAPRVRQQLSQAQAEGLGRVGHEMTAPLEAVIALSSAMRLTDATLSQQQVLDRATNIEVAAWRIVRLVDDLKTATASASGARSHRIREVDLCRFFGRATRLAEAKAAVAGVSVARVDAATAGKGLVALIDEDVLWGVLDDLFADAVSAAGEDGRIMPRLVLSDDGGATLEIVSQRSRPVLEVKSRTAALEAVKPVPEPVVSFEQTQRLGQFAGASVSRTAGDSDERSWAIHVPGSRIVSLG